MEIRGEAGATWTLYTAGYRDSGDDKRLPPEVFYSTLPEEAVVVDIRANAYSPFAPAYTGSGVAEAVRAVKPGRKECFHVRELGNTRRGGSHKRVSPPIFVNGEAGFARLADILREYGAAVIFCACAKATLSATSERCHRFTVADEMQRRFPGLRIVHLPLDEV